MSSVDQDVLPQGVYDMAALGDELDDPNLDRRIAQLFDASQPMLAKYKINVIFMGERSAFKAYPGIIVLWKRQDDNESMVYLCPAKVDGKPCNAPFETGLISQAAKIAVCPRCGATTPPKDLIGQVVARLPTQRWAQLVRRVFGILGGNADIELNYITKSIRKAHAQTIEHRGVGNDAYHAVRDTRQAVTYTLRRMIEDTASGVGVTENIHNFLKA